ncbi:MAG TPA: polyhydroxyalkanoate synthesis repressor PhaR, partial [Alphaproteobacteria bacterium]|nr:polyhydroxyalkanoate synthesis repressor PhaR [Alphaproteobacteria bacterium]
MTNAKHKSDLVIIKKYANRRLYHTAKSAYVTLEDLSNMTREGIDFEVVDAKTGEDLTRQVLTQIIVEQESKGQHLLPTAFLRQLIGFYGGEQSQQLLPGYLSYAMEQFGRNQEQLYVYMTSALQQAMPETAAMPFAAWGQMSQQNLRAWEGMMTEFFSQAASWLHPLASNENDHSRLNSLTQMQKNLHELQDHIQTLSSLK